MVGTTSPVVHGERGWRLFIAIYTLSQIAGALVTGFLIWVLGKGLGALLGTDAVVAAVLTAVAAAIAAVHDSQLMTLRLPTSRWQVSRNWKRFPRPIVAAMFGFGIGTSVLTRIPFATFHVVLFATLLLANLQFSLLVMFVHGAIRALVVAIASQLQLLISDVRQRPKAINRFAPLVGYLNGIVLAGAAGILVGALSSALQQVQ